jgi:hypothetical protein
MIGETDQPSDPLATALPTPANAESAAASTAAGTAATVPIATAPIATNVAIDTVAHAGAMTKEIGGRDGLDPVRYGDWEKNGRCIDF